MKENTVIKSIVVKDLEENYINLMKDYKNKNLLLIIYNNQCLGCTGRAIPLAYEFKNNFDNITVIGIHTNFGIKKTSVQDIKSIFTSGELPFPIYLDEDASVYNQFESMGTPQWLIITKDGKLYRSIFGSQEGAQNRLSYAIASLKESY